MLKDGAGAKPGASDYVLVDYIGYLAANGTVFDQNAAQAFPAGGVIKGFLPEGLQMMNKGSIWRFRHPRCTWLWRQGDGADTPAKSDLAFQVELVDFKTEAEIAAMRAQNAAAAAGRSGQPAADTPAPAAPTADKPKN
jgi:FKBP-type peptidyl-prolyl cis-trans isomerase FkpA